ncbi:hypothetical protein TNCV_520111 [Trichonephila clavipes]|nr:hypothetical protein TNCV_520111 [Trichonephila clavipes]
MNAASRPLWRKCVCPVRRFAKVASLAGVDANHMSGINLNDKLLQRAAGSSPSVVTFWREDTVWFHQVGLCASGTHYFELSLALLVLFKNNGPLPSNVRWIVTYGLLTPGGGGTSSGEPHPDYDSLSKHGFTPVMTHRPIRQATNTVVRSATNKGYLATATQCFPSRGCVRKKQMGKEFICHLPVMTSPPRP